MSDGKQKVYKLGLEILDEVREACQEQLNVSHHALSFYLAEKPEFLDPIALLSDLLTINYRMLKEIDRIEQTCEIDGKHMYLTEDQLTLLEAGTLSKVYAADDLKKSCLVSVYYN